MDARRVLQDAPYAIHYCTMPRYSKRGLNGSATKSRKSFMKRDGPLAARSHTRFILRRYSLSPSLFCIAFPLFLSLSLSVPRFLLLFFVLPCLESWRTAFFSTRFLFDPPSLLFEICPRGHEPPKQRGFLLTCRSKSTRPLRPPCTPRCFFL